MTISGCIDFFVQFSPPQSYVKKSQLHIASHA